MGVDADARTGREHGVRDAAGRGQEIVCVVLGIDAQLDRRARHADVLRPETQGPALGDSDLLGDEIEAENGFAHRMLDLDARVHLQK